MKTDHNIEDRSDLLHRLKALNDIGVALSSEKDGQRLLEKILQAARALTYADGGTLYTKTDDNHLKFEIMLSESLDIHQGGTSQNEITLPPLPLYDEKGASNLHMVAVCAALKEQTINIPDAYENTEFEFSGTKAFDESMNYRSKSFLTVPMKDHENELIGVLQLINAIDPHSGEINPFTQQEQELVESLASQAAVALVNQRLLDEQRILFESFIKLIARAIDDKSPYTANHCLRVPELTMLLAKAVDRCQIGPEEIRQFSMDEDDRYELWVAGMLHDCGKITTKEYIVDKATKLETKYDRIHEVDTRFEVLKRDAEIELLRAQLAAAEQGQAVEHEKMAQDLAARHTELDAERDFLRHSNVGGEFMTEEAQERVRRIGQRQWRNPQGETVDLLSDNEIYNLTIAKGTLTPEERTHINHHIVSTINMLQSLPYPKHLQRVPEFAGGHHERMDGKGYPNGLKREEMSLQARVMGIADIFEALTAGDRPYKKAMPLSTALTILGKMKLDNHIDPDLFDVFVHEKVYLEYAKAHLPKEQWDEDFDVTQLPGYNPDFGKA